MIGETVLFGEMQIPENKPDILLKLDRCKEQYIYRPSRYMQARIDVLEDTLDMFRRKEDV